MSSSPAASPLGSTAPAPAPAPSPSPSAAAPPPSSAAPPPPLPSTTAPPPPSSTAPTISFSPPPPAPPAANSAPTTTAQSPKLITASPPPPPPPPPSLSSSPSSVSATRLISVGVGGVLVVSIITITIIICCLCRKTRSRMRMRKKKTDHRPRQESYGLPEGGLPAHAIYKDSSYDSPNLRPECSHSPFYSTASILIKPPPPPPPPLVVAPFKRGYDAIPNATPGIGNSKYRFTFEELEVATDGFSMSNKLGEGGFGCVYKGRVSGGQLVAVKQLKVGASQGEKEFQAEVEIISRVHHRHLVSLVGYCISEHQRLLVYDYVPNGTLEYHLHKRKNGRALDWSMRLRIACGAARGLAYLHEDCHPRIIHRDIKSSNILLDDKFEAQVSDFGLAKLTADTDTHVTTRVMGTFGYLAPEYASSGKLTEKSDVFSFGVVLLELLTGRKPVDVSQPMGQESLVEWARPLLGQINSEVYLDIVADPDLNGVYDPKEMLRMVKAAAACVRHSASRRPRMGLVLRALEAEISLLDLEKGLRPGHSSRDYDHEHSSSDNIAMRKFKKLALESQEFETKYSGTTSAEYQSSAMMSSGEYQQIMARQGTRLTPEAIASSSSTSSPTTQVGTPLANHTSFSGLNRDMRSDRDQNVPTSPSSRLYQQTKANRGTSSSSSDEHSGEGQHYQPQPRQ